MGFNMAKLITEYSPRVNISESKSNGNKLTITGVFSSYNVKNENARIYPKSILEREVERVRESIQNRTCYGNLNHPESPDVDLENAAILIEEVAWDGNDLMGKAVVLNTPKGQIIKGIHESGGKFGISSRGLGTVNESTGEVNEDFELITWDVVPNASNPASKYVNGILEGVEFDHRRKELIQKAAEDVLTEEKAQEEYYKYILEALDKLRKDY